MTEPTGFTHQPHGASPPAMPTTPSQETSPAMAERLHALQASRAASALAPATPAATTVASTKKTARSSGPAPSRILAAAASVSAGIGLVALMAGAQQDIVVQASPTPVTVQPASVIVELQPTSPGGQNAPEVQVRVVEQAAPAERPVPQARVVTQSEGS